MAEPPNKDQADYWNAADHWVHDEGRHDAMLGPLGRLAIDALPPRPGERILDLGCGTGGTSLELADAVGGAGSVVGADLSVPMLEVARRRARDRPNVSFLEADVQTHPFGNGSFDGAFSRFGVMFFADPTEAFANVARTLAPRGRLSCVVWQAPERNEWIAVATEAVARVAALPARADPLAPGPFVFADEERFRRVLEGAGLAGVRIEGAEHPMILGGYGTIDDAVRFAAQSRVVGAPLADADAATKDAILACLREAFEPYQTPEGVRFGAAVWVASARCT